MEAGDYTTNTLVIHNISSVEYRTYELSATSDYQSQPNPTAIQDVEALLRSRGCVAHFDTARRIIWHFKTTTKEDAIAGNSWGPSLPDDLHVQGVTLSPVDDGSFEPASLSRARIPNTQGRNTPTSGMPGSASESFNQPKSATPFSPAASGSSPMWGGTDLDTKALSVDLKAASFGALTINDAYDNFVLALLGTLLSDLVSRTGAIPLDNRTALLSPRQHPGEVQGGLASKVPAAATLRIYLTPIGSLVIALALHPAGGFLSLDQPQPRLPLPPPSDTQTLVAPFGVRAFYQGTPDIAFPHLETGLAQSPDTQISRPGESRSSPWRQVCTRLLQLKGLSAQVLDSTPWITIKIPRQKYLDQRQEGKPPIVINTTTAISWPACLCFRKQTASLPPTCHVGGNTLIGHTESYDPLASAKAWFEEQESPERKEMLAKRKREQQVAASRDSASDLSRHQIDSTSPLALQRGGNAAPAAASVMYPTPPDGVQNPNVPTPSLDGAVSSPQPPPPTVSVVDTDVVMSNAEPLEVPNVEPERNEASYLGDSDNLFDDLGGDMFNDDELTDADFNFFDEPAVSTELRMDDVVSDVRAPNSQASALETSQQSQPLPASPRAAPTNDAGAAATGDAMANEPVIKQEPPVFAKPELRHARSTLGYDAKSGIKPHGAGKGKREHSPFDPDTVFKRVRTSLYHQHPSGKTQLGRKKSAYDTVEFDRILNPVTSKYATGGKFAVNWEPKKEVPDTKKAPPTTDYLKHHGKQSKAIKALPENHSTLIARITSGLESSSIQGSPTKLDSSSADVDDMSTMSDQDDTSVSSEEAFSPVKSAGPTRRAYYDDDSISQATSLRDIELSEESDPSFALELPRLGKAGAADVPVHKLFADPEPLALQLSLPDEDLISVAQVLTEQAALGSLEILSDGSSHTSPPPGPHRRRQLASMTRQALKTLQESVSGYLGGVVEPHFRAFAEIQDGTPLLGPAPRTHLQPRPVPGRDPEHMKPPIVYQIPPPHLEVKRAETRLSVLPSAVSFWETLGLGPSLGPKNIQAACVFPGWDGMTDNTDLFLDRVKSTYESMKLGTFERLPSTADISDGIVRYDVDKISVTPGYVFPRISSALAERVELLCQALLASGDPGKNFVIFFLYSPANPSSIVEACTSFRQLSEAYESPMPGRKAPENELVLQLVPLDLVSSSSSVVIQSQAELLKLCLETYDRCTIPDGPMPAPSIMLEQVASRYIDFSLSSAGSASVMHENSCIHVAYARSVDGRWITAAWTDTRGRQQMVASYCLGRKGRPLATAFADVAHEIWETTHDLISMWRVHWRVVVTKCEAMDIEEVEFWTGLAQTESKARVSLVLLAVDTGPSLQLLPPAARLNPAVSAAFYSTPASTPQPSILSPEQSGNPGTPSSAPTPGGEGPGGGSPALDGNGAADGILVDTLDQTWGCILSHKLSNSTAVVSLNPSLFSGYLVKRGGTRAEDPPVAMEVNLLHSDGNPRQHEGLLREMLGHFRALGTLARARGVAGEADVRPWHVAAAEKGARALHLLM